MTDLSKSDNFFLPDFSHIYVEEGAENFSMTADILKRLPSAEAVSVQDYKSVFNRSGQDFQAQKKSMKLIIAVKKDGFLYKATDVVQDAGYRNFMYTTPILNCLYNCRYCFLQGMYPSANLVVFVNDLDFFSSAAIAVNERSVKDEPLLLSVSYSTDLLAFENVVPWTRKWMDFCESNTDIVIEVRTKSALFSAIKDENPSEQVLLAWTLSPEVVAEMYEWDAPPIDRRINAVQQAIEKGWKVRLCLDPVIPVPGWRKIYSDFIEKIKKDIPAEGIRDVTVGTFRMGKDFFKRARKRMPPSDVYYQNYEERNGVISLPESESAAVADKIKGQLADFISDDRIAVWD
jgi:spore photoproduct lyase